MKVITFFSSFEKFLRSGINAIFYFWAAALVGKESFGLLVVTLATLSFVTPLLSGGLEPYSVAKFINTSEKNKLNYQFQETGTLLCLYSLLFLFLTLGIFKYNQIPIVILLVMFIPLVFSRFYEVDRYWEFSRFDIRKNIIIDYVGIIISLFLKILVIKFQENIVEYLLLIIIFEMYSNSLIRILLSKKLTRIRFKRVPKYLIGTSLMLIFSGVLQAGFSKIDLIMVPYLFDKSMAADYGFSIRIFDVFLIISSVISSILPGYISKQGSIDGINSKLIKTAFKISFAMILMMLLAKTPIEFFIDRYLDEYLASFKNLFYVLFLLPAFSLIGAITGFVLISHGKSNLVMASASICFVVNIVLNILLSPIFGLMGFAIATITCSFLYSIVLPFIFLKVIKVKL
jgi:O-antigen/teichoic acid export membrane protein